MMLRTFQRIAAHMPLQDVMNMRNVCYEHYGLWDHFPSGIYGHPRPQGVVPLIWMPRLPCTH